jgi:hypothetical protein
MRSNLPKRINRADQNHLRNSPSIHWPNDFCSSPLWRFNVITFLFLFSWTGCDDEPVLSESADASPQQDVLVSERERTDVGYAIDAINTGDSPDGESLDSSPSDIRDSGRDNGYDSGFSLDGTDGSADVSTSPGLCTDEIQGKFKEEVLNAKKDWYTWGIMSAYNCYNYPGTTIKIAKVGSIVFNGAPSEVALGFKASTLVSFDGIPCTELFPDQTTFPGRLACQRSFLCGCCEFTMRKEWSPFGTSGPGIQAGLCTADFVKYFSNLYFY